MIALVFRSRSAVSSPAFGSMASPSPASSVSDLIQYAESLRNIGKSYLSAKQYSSAAQCYAAVLQVMEGVGGNESGELRRRCTLTLAECEIKSGNLYAAIARCSEVIEECPEFDDIEPVGEEEEETVSNHDVNSLRHALGQAYYRRGVSLSRLDEPELALLDLQEALKKIPDDIKILQRIETAESIILGQNSSNQLNVPSEADHREQLQAIVEDAQVNYERSFISKSQIRDLLQRKDRSSSLQAGRNAFSSSGDGLADTNPLAALIGEGGDRVEALLGQASGFISVAKSVFGQGIENILRTGGILLRMFSGFEEEKIVLLEDIAKAFIDVFRIFKKAHQLIHRHSLKIVSGFVFIFLGYVCRDAYIL